MKKQLSFWGMVIQQPLEAMNCQLVDNLVALYFVPTIESKENQLNEHRAEKHILVLRDIMQKLEGVRFGT
ncbi:UDP-N-acetylglucosamine 2-epimerase [Enterococcus rotai]|uniref:Uncharacterized protein n=1 Tax=Enterococcus rotai TaxID=118060 RepID=A0A0U2WV75_9ENTE|nr:hypothetical protein [Enterococcus rotai]ALS35914.1 hypothetical protein ATZ35_01705 [Enterococcus rotai]